MVDSAVASAVASEVASEVGSEVASEAGSVGSASSGSSISPGSAGLASVLELSWVCSATGAGDSWAAQPERINRRAAAPIKIFIRKRTSEFQKGFLDQAEVSTQFFEPKDQHGSLIAILIRGFSLQIRRLCKRHLTNETPGLGILFGEKQKLSSWVQQRPVAAHQLLVSDPALTGVVVDVGLEIVVSVIAKGRTAYRIRKDKHRTGLAGTDACPGVTTKACMQLSAQVVAADLKQLRRCFRDVPLVPGSPG